MPRDAVDWFEVMAKVESGDRAALLRLTGLVATILARVGAYQDSSSREDLVQDVTLSLLTSVRRGAIREPERFVGYAWAIARNRWITSNKSRARRDALLDGGVDPEKVAAPGADPGVPADRTADPGTRIDLERALETLPMPEREVIEAIYLRGLSYAETCEALGVPLGTVKRRQWNGLRTIRESLGIASRA